MKNLLKFILNVILFLPLWFCIFAPLIFYIQNAKAEEFINTLMFLGVLCCGLIIAHYVSVFIETVFNDEKENK